MLAGALVLGSLGLVHPPAQLRGVMRNLLARLTSPEGTDSPHLMPRLLRALALRLARQAGEIPAGPLAATTLATTTSAAPTAPQPVHFSTAATELA